MRIPSKTQLFIDGLKKNAGNGNRPLFLDETGAISARWQNLTLSSVFQPIYKYAERTDKKSSGLFKKISNNFVVSLTKSMSAVTGICSGE